MPLQQVTSMTARIGSSTGSLIWGLLGMQAHISVLKIISPDSQEIVLSIPSLFVGFDGVELHGANGKSHERS